MWEKGDVSRLLSTYELVLERVFLAPIYVLPTSIGGFTAFYLRPLNFRKGLSRAHNGVATMSAVLKNVMLLTMGARASCTKY